MKGYASVLLLIFIYSVHGRLSFCPPSSLLTRTLDGGCNNLLFKERGKVGSFYSNGPEGREAYPWVYETQPEPVPTYENVDQIISDGPRGNPRNISHVLARRHDENDVDVNGHSMFSVMFGQFINHDLENTRTLDAHVVGNADLKTYMLSQDDPGCYANPQIPISQREYFCLNNDTVLNVGIKSSVGVFDENGTLKVYNDASSYFDLNQVYGRSKEINNMLRSGEGGKMLVVDTIDVEFDSVVPNLPPVQKTLENILPFYEDVPVPLDPIYANSPLNKSVFSGGDERLNQNIALTFFHTLFVREHNKICDELIDNNVLYRLLPKKFDDVIFERARSILIAKYQHILYEQYLPSAYGKHFADKVGTYQGYKMFEDPSTSALFANVGLRYGHYTPKSYFTLDECGEPVVNNMNVPMKQPFVGFQNPTPLALSAIGRMADSGGLDNVARGLIEQVTHRNHFTVEEILRNFPALKGSFDLATIDILRARYDSIPNYQMVRKHYFDDEDPLINSIYGLEDCPASLEEDDEVSDPIECFLHITSDTEKAASLKDLFSKINNIDAIVGASLEDHVDGTSFGPTIGNIIVDQFKRSRDADRFFYKNPTEWLKFSSSIRQEIQSTTMGEILRRNLQDSKIQFPDNPFIVPEDYRMNMANNC